MTRVAAVTVVLAAALTLIGMWRYTAAGRRNRAEYRRAWDEVDQAVAGRAASRRGER